MRQVFANCRMKIKPLLIIVSVILVIGFGGTKNALSGDPIRIAGVSLDEAAKKIMEKHQGRILSAGTKVVDGRVVHVFKVLTPDGRIQHIKVDSATGAIHGKNTP